MDDEIELVTAVAVAVLSHAHVKAAEISDGLWSEIACAAVAVIFRSMYRSAVIHRRYFPADSVDCLDCLGLSERPFLALAAELFYRETALELFFSEQCIACIRANLCPEIVMVAGSHCISCIVVISN